MMLFYVCAEGEDDEDLARGEDDGVFISAPNAKIAARMWREKQGRTNPLVFRVPPVSPKPMVHTWHVSWDKRGAQRMDI